MKLEPLSPTAYLTSSKYKDPPKEKAGKVQFIYTKEFELPNFETDLEKSKPSEEIAINPRRFKASNNGSSLNTRLFDNGLLTKEMESYMFKKMNFLKHKASKLNFSSTEAQKLISEAEDVRNTIALSNTRLVYSFVKSRFSFLKLEKRDNLIAEGSLILLKAVDGFDINKNTRFTTYLQFLLSKQLTHFIDKQINEPLCFTAFPDDQEVESLDNISPPCDRKRVLEREQKQRFVKEVIEELVARYIKDKNKGQLFLAYHFFYEDEEFAILERGLKSTEKFKALHEKFENFFSLSSMKTIVSNVKKELENRIEIEKERQIELIKNLKKINVDERKVLTAWVALAEAYIFSELSPSTGIYEFLALKTQYNYLELDVYTRSALMRLPLEGVSYKANFNLGILILNNE